MEFPALFLGAMPDKIPALYSLMNHAAFTQGTWYPMGGMGKVIDAMADIAKGMGVKFHVGTEVKKITVQNGTARALETNKGRFEFDGLISSGDYHHTETKLLDQEWRNYDESYWNKKTMAPSSLIFYLGINKRLPVLTHHNLFFDTDFQKHAREIYSQPNWPSDPLFYTCVPSKTDPSVAPEGMENLFILIPIAAGLEDTEQTRERYYEQIMNRLESHCATKIREHVIVKRSYCVNDFKMDYHAYKGNAYGLANTLSQTAHLKPKIRNKKISNLYYSGQLTVPGPGVPPSIISGQIAATELIKNLTKVYETVV